MIQAIALLALLAAPQAEKKEAKWLTKYQEAVQQAQREGKPLVIDAGRAG